MPNRIRIQSKKIQVRAVLNDGVTAQKIWSSLPMEGTANTWGEEVYFAIPVEAEPEPGARVEMAVGELGYWPPGAAFCIFFGRTPASRASTPVAASPVNVLGQVTGDPLAFRGVREGDKVVLEKDQ